MNQIYSECRGEGDIEDADCDDLHKVEEKGKNVVKEIYMDDCVHWYN